MGKTVKGFLRTPTPTRPLSTLARSSESRLRFPLYGIFFIAQYVWSRRKDNGRRPSSPSGKRHAFSSTLYRQASSSYSSSAFLNFSKNFMLHQLVNHPRHGLNILKIILVFLLLFIEKWPYYLHSIRRTTICFLSTSKMLR